ncbi:MAG: crotonase [Bacteroidales bacterium]|jgi:enoyl-CoA hydratase|nr:enoyl-CoA hydratase-related protein [Bacteroidales bacterium]MCK9498784.1 enoyl-CoA hydratase-related protein [Bacteroidales bacterium]MDY0315158.1 enoyl-CoA hydratase-related protein [Bacteroidales bacterium]NLB86563.1 crotonase [Bacteroidales bacterium]
MEYTNIEVQINESSAQITMNRPQALNALNSQVFVELNSALDEIEKNDNLRALIITGNGKAFVAGADIGEMSEMNEEQAYNFAKTGHDTFNRIANLKIPVIAAINGFALGGGCEFAMACDIRIANTFAKFGQPEVNLGLIPGYCGTQRLSRIIGLSNALHLLLTADMIDANEALRLGLVQKVTEPEDLLNEANKIVSKITSKGKLAIEKAKEVTVKGINMDFDSASKLEVEEFSKLFGKPESKEGMTAFLEKRKPNW